MLEYKSIFYEDSCSKYIFLILASLSDTGKFRYTPGNTYEYTYEGKTETKLQGSSDQTTSLKIQATADIEVISQCEFALKVRKCSPVLIEKLIVLNFACWKCFLYCDLQIIGCQPDGCSCN